MFGLPLILVSAAIVGVQLLIEYGLHRSPRWRDPRFKWIEPHELPDSVRDYFHEHADELLALGYRHVGDSRTDARNFRAYTRNFLSPEGQILAEIYCTDGVNRNRGRCCNMVFDDGGYAALTTRPVTNVGETAFPLTLISLPDAETRDLHAAALKYLEMQFERGTRPLVLTKESIFDLKLYAHRLLAWHLATQGKLQLPSDAWQSSSYQPVMA